MEAAQGAHACAKTAGLVETAPFLHAKRIAVDVECVKESNATVIRATLVRIVGRKRVLSDALVMENAMN